MTPAPRRRLAALSSSPIQHRYRLLLRLARHPPGSPDLCTEFPVRDTSVSERPCRAIGAGPGRPTRSVAPVHGSVRCALMCRSLFVPTASAHTTGWPTWTAVWRVARRCWYGCSARPIAGPAASWAVRRLLSPCRARVRVRWPGRQHGRRKLPGAAERSPRMCKPRWTDCSDVLERTARPFRLMITKVFRAILQDRPRAPRVMACGASRPHMSHFTP